MPAPLFLFGLALATQAIAAAPMRVSGVPIRGRVHDVSVGDMQSEIYSFHSWDKLASLEVIGPDDMRAHLDPSDRGWVPLHRALVEELCGCRRIRHLKWQADRRRIEDIAPALRVIRTAEHAFAFPLPHPDAPRRDDTQLRPLSPDARARLANLLGAKGDWLTGDQRDIAPNADSPPGLGLLFRKGSEEVVLFLGGHGWTEATWNGQNTIGQLDLDAEAGMRGWTFRFAQVEMGNAGGSR